MYGTLEIEEEGYEKDKNVVGKKKCYESLDYKVSRVKTLELGFTKQNQYVTKFSENDWDSLNTVKNGHALIGY